MFKHARSTMASRKNKQKIGHKITPILYLSPPAGERPQVYLGCSGTCLWPLNCEKTRVASGTCLWPSCLLLALAYGLYQIISSCIFAIRGNASPKNQLLPSSGHSMQSAVALFQKTRAIESSTI